MVGWTGQLNLFLTIFTIFLFLFYNAFLADIKITWETIKPEIYDFFIIGKTFVKTSLIKISSLFCVGLVFCSLFTCYHPCSPSPRENMPFLGPSQANTIIIWWSNQCQFNLSSIHEYQSHLIISSDQTHLLTDKGVIDLLLVPLLAFKHLHKAVSKERGFIQNRPDDHIHISQSE